MNILWPQQTNPIQIFLMMGGFEMPEIVIDEESLTSISNSNIKFDKYSFIENIENFDIFEVIYDNNNFVLTLNKKKSDEKINLCFNEVQRYWSSNIDFNNICKMILTYTSTTSIYISNREKSKMFEVMIWDIHDETHPCLRITAKKLIVTANDSAIVLKKVN